MRIDCRMAQDSGKGLSTRRADGQRFRVRADERLTALVELETADSWGLTNLLRWLQCIIGAQTVVKRARPQSANIQGKMQTGRG
jgi:hypothetical protein